MKEYDEDSYNDISKICIRLLDITALLEHSGLDLVVQRELA